ncbi:DNA-binding NarL/FixJ family response regulator [Kibdelosporangium banguiense]|uniref:DNA-binding NarL/FixJ family response regulator n=1 Tax=Kibdelosporangium banguiense TaxID=1365924 RepID=A0ABS4TNY2_9PSEU|nr:response regulator transcription factor [Kibdelosporangium banguiense]MBP2325643.1 DNA-binding NarL/FixJ family response regulator [Kibdelosporangium banguiense]
MRVLVVDDHPVTRGGVVAGLAPEFTAFEADSIESASKSVAADSPQVVLVDLQLGDENGVDLIQALAERHPGVRILVLSQAPLADVVQAIRAGAHGYVGKSASTADLRAAVQAVIDGPVVPPELAARLVAEFRQDSSLTAREQDVLRALARGFDNREIADDLAISVRTVNRHLESIRDKLGTRRRSELMRIARERHSG